MSENHCWCFIRRIVCAAAAIAVAAVCFNVLPALAVEGETVPAARTDTDSNVSDLDVVPLIEPASGVETLGFGQTEVSDDTAALSVPEESRDQKAYEEALEELFAEDNETYELILSVQRKKDRLSPAIIGLQRGFEYYLPMAEIARIVNLEADLDIDSQTLSGSIFNTGQIYRVNADEGTYTLDGETQPIPEESIIVRRLQAGLGDIYATPDFINTIWPLELEVNFADLAVEINMRQRLPYELERQRKKRQEQLADRADEEENKGDYEYTPNNYRWFSDPVLTLTDSVIWNQDENDIQNSLTVSGRNDLIGTSADYSANILYKKGEPVDLQNLRLRLTRRDHGLGTLPTGLKLMQAGDISAKPSPLIEKILFGRGAYVSSEDNARKQTFDEITVEGTAQPGWEVEVYRGRQLIDFGVVDERGQYRFENIQLTYGKNTIRILLYGPQGQVEERTEEYRIDQTKLATGETTFEAAVVDNRARLIEVDDRPERADEGWGHFIRINRGLTPTVTAFATATSIPTAEGEKTYATLGADFLAFSGIGQIEGYQELGGGNILDLRFSKNFAGINTSFRSSFFRNFESRVAGFGDNARTFEGEFRANKSFILPIGILGLNLNTLHTKFKDDRSDTLISGRQSLSLDNFEITNNLNTTLDNSRHESTRGRISIRTGLNENWSLRSSLDYDVYPEKRSDLFKLNLRYNDFDRFTAGVNLDKGLQDNDTLRVGANADYDFGTFLGGAEVNWQKNEGIDVLLRATTTFGPDGHNKNRDYIFSSDYKGYNTALKVRLFHDQNLDGVYGPGDEPVEGAKIRVNGHRNSVDSDADGYININNAGREGLVEITLDRERLPDPFLAMVVDGYRTVVRPGTKPFIDIPLILTGTIDGTVYLADGSPAPGIIVQLLSLNGEVLQEAPTSFDGFYIFEYIKPGTYTVRVNPSHKVFVPALTVSVTSGELLSYGNDLQILEQAGEVSAGDESDGSRGRVAQQHHAPPADGTVQPAPLTSDSGFQAAVRSVRIGEHPYKVRLVLDLSAPSDYKITSEDGGQIINIDLPSTAWDAKRDFDLSKHPIFRECEVLALIDKNGQIIGTRLRLTTRAPTEIFYNTTLPAEDGKPDRIYADFIKKK